jgi:hypothetical protein
VASEDGFPNGPLHRRRSSFPLQQCSTASPKGGEKGVGRGAAARGGRGDGRILPVGKTQVGLLPQQSKPWPVPDDGNHPLGPLP